MARPDVVLVKPGSQKAIYGELSAFRLTAIEPPLWGSILAAYLREQGLGVELWDAEVEEWSWEETARRLAEARPVLAVVTVSGSNPSASTMNMLGAGAIVRHLAELAPHVPSMLWGLHPSALPERTTREEAAHFVCQGEGLVTLPALVEALKAGMDPARDEFPIPGLWYAREGRSVSHPMPPVLDDLDRLPMPAWDLLPMDRYRAHNWHCFDDVTRRSPYAVLYTSLGCPFRCSFCCINALFGKNAIRYRGLDAVMAELDVLVGTYGIRNVKIMDEMFAMNEKRVNELCERIEARGYDLNFWAYARVNTVTEPMLERMKRAGINWLAYGFESGSKRVIEDVTKGYKPEAVLDVVAKTYAQDIHICANFIFGLPEDDYDSMQETLNLMFQINAEWANIYSAMAYPGSRLYEQAVESGWPLPATWQAFSQYSPECTPLPTKYLDGGQVLAFRDYAFHAYHENPRYLDMIRSKFGEATMRHIQAMSEKRLARRNARV